MEYHKQYRGASKMGNLVSVDLKNCFNTFKKENPKIKIEFSTFKSIIDNTLAEMQDDIVNNELGFKLPVRLGIIAITKYKPKNNKKIDWQKSKELGKTVYHLNYHSDGYSARVQHFKSGMNSTGLAIYKFIATRTLQNKKSKLLKEGKVYNSYKTEDFATQQIRFKLNELYL